MHTNIQTRNYCIMSSIFHWGLVGLLGNAWNNIMFLYVSRIMLVYLSVPFFLPSLSLPISLSVCVTLCLSLSLALSVCLSLSLYICLHVSLSMFVCMSLSMSICLSVCLSLSLCMYVSLCLLVSVPPNSHLSCAHDSRFQSPVFNVKVDESLIQSFAFK